MTDERWRDLLGRLEDEHKIESREREEFAGRPGSVERVIITSPLGKLRLSRTTEPKKLNEKTLYSKRGGSTASIQAVYDETEQIHVFTVEKQDPSGEWAHLDASSLPF